MNNSDYKHNLFHNCGNMPADYMKIKDQENTRELMREQYELIKKQRQEINEQRKYREESRMASKQVFKYTIVGIVIASLTLIATIIGWFI